VHKVHHIRDALDARELMELLEPPLTRIGYSTANVTVEQATAAYAYDEPEEARLKFLLNRVLPFDRREQVVDEVFAQVVDNEQAFCERLYMSAAAVTELERDYRAVGAHSYAHQPLALLDAATLHDDLVRSAQVLGSITGVPPRTMSYPHGSLEAVDSAVAEAAAVAGFQVGFTMERAFNGSLEDPLLLARVDTNDAPGGARPLFAVGDDGGLSTTGRMTIARTRYVAEVA
jgi:peptidoglycan/xylan/chitin deacetylase (PgdA/CDA1 family)